MSILFHFWFFCIYLYFSIYVFPQFFFHISILRPGCVFFCNDLALSCSGEVWEPGRWREGEPATFYFTFWWFLDTPTHTPFEACPPGFFLIFGTSREREGGRLAPYARCSRQCFFWGCLRNWLRNGSAWVPGQPPSPREGVPKILGEPPGVFKKRRLVPPTSFAYYFFLHNSICSRKLLLQCSTHHQRRRHQVRLVHNRDLILSIISF